MKTPKKNPHFHKNAIALAVAAICLPSSVWALEFVQEPPVPKTTSTYVAPNIILSLDDSTSMDAKDMVLKDPSQAYNWQSNPYTKTRTQTLKDALLEVFNDKILLPDGKIRLAWHSFGMLPEGGGWRGCTSVSGASYYRLNNSSASASKYTNTMRVLEGTHRENFIKYVNAFSSCASTPTHWMVKGADDYMRASLHKNGPWADKPGERLASNVNGNKPLGCRRNYHILLTDGDWNGEYRKNYPVNTSPVNFDNQDSNRNIHGKEETQDGVQTFAAFKLPDGTEYNRDDPNTWVYRDIDYPTWSSWHPGYTGQYLSTLSDWSFKSWATNLQNPSSLSGSVTVSKDYKSAPAQETFKNPKTNKTATLDKYWNPRYNPATWPHMVTYTIGFSNDSIPKDQYRPMGANSETDKNIGRYWMDNKIFDHWYDKEDGFLWQFDGPSLATNTNSATNNGNSGQLITPSSTLPYGFDGSFADYVAGRAQWFAVSGKASQDMWHAAINGRGRFYAVEKGEDLKLAFQHIINSINEENAALPGEIHATNASSSYSVINNNAGTYVAGYSPKDGWRGWVQASSAVEPGEPEPCGELEGEYVNPDDPDATTPTPPTTPDMCISFPSVIEGWEGKTTANRLDELNDIQVKGNGRLILGWNDKTNKSALFKWDNDGETYMSTAQKALLGKKNNATPAPAIEERGENILNYIRGDTNLAGSEVDSIKADKPLRKRISRQGDIINSEIWYTEGPIANYGFDGYKAYRTTYINREPMLYVGGNDGMLHGFSAKDGTEKIAYVPRGILGKLKDLADPDYINKHQYFVDGSPMAGDVKTGADSDASAWKTMLVGTLGAGGKGYFVLDVTNPDNFKESSAADLVVMDKTFAKDEATTGNDADIGYITAPPVRKTDDPNQTTQIAKMNNGRWAAIMGNGYNSDNQRPALLIQYLDGNKDLIVVPATEKTKNDTCDPNSSTELKKCQWAEDNGLASPALVDLDGNRTPDIAYAGDNQGNMWKFDLLSDRASEWKVAFEGEPLFTAKGPLTAGGGRTEPQPITVPPVVRANNRMMAVDIGGGETKSVAVGGMMVAFGTGRNLTEEDRSTTNNSSYAIQSVYSILDNTRYEKDAVTGNLQVCTIAQDTACVSAPESLGVMGEGVKLAERKILLQKTANGKLGEKLDDSEVLGRSTWSEYKGWYADLPNGVPGETAFKVKRRVLKPLDFYLGTEVLEVRSIVPVSTTASDVENQESVEVCSSTSVSIDDGREFVTYLNVMDGQKPPFQILGYLGGGNFDANWDGFIGKEIPPNSHKTISTGDGAEIHSGADGGGAPIPEQSMRPSWRQIQ